MTSSVILSIVIIVIVTDQTNLYKKYINLICLWLEGIIVDNMTWLVIFISILN